MRHVQRVPGIPHWFVRLLSWWYWRKHCRTGGHAYTRWDSCDKCGEWKN